MSTPTRPPGGPRPVTLTITDPRARDADADAIGTCLVTLVPGRFAAHDPNAWAITHPLGSPTGGTHTEVVFVDGSTSIPDARLVDDLVRQVANAVYGRLWAFHYRPERKVDAVLAHGSLLRERIEVSSIEVWT